MGEDTVSELEKIAWTAAFTIFGGTLVYAIGQLLSKFLIDPTHELIKEIGEVRFNLAFYGPTIQTSTSRTPEESKEVYEALLKSSCELLAKVNAIPSYGLVSCISFGFLPPKKQIREAATQLRGLSTYMYQTGDKASSSFEAIGNRVDKIVNCLNMEPRVYKILCAEP
jgi:hypothetical protein